MPVEFLTANVSIPEGKGERNIDGSVTTSPGSVIRRAGIAVNGFRLDYVDKDHHINLVEVDTRIVNFADNHVNFRVKCHYADKDFNDPYKGYVEVLVIADVA
jgi:hypothetical protein